MRRQNSWTDPTIIGEHRGTLWFHRPEINSISGNVVIRPFPSHASKFPPRRLTTWLASPGLIRTRPLHPIERNWLHASHPLTIGEAVDFLQTLRRRKSWSQDRLAEMAKVS